MPQMAPMNWLTLFLYFTIIFLFFNSFNYFSFSYTQKESNLVKILTSKKLSWKW